jgi:hypothetical protein
MGFERPREQCSRESKIARGEKIRDERLNRKRVT